MRMTMFNRQMFLMLGFLVVGWTMGFVGGRIYEYKPGPVMDPPKVVYKYVEKESKVNYDGLIDYVYQNSVVDRPTATKIVRKTFELSKRPLLALALFQKESNFNPFATGDNGKSVGLGQIHKQNHKEIKDKLNIMARELYDIENNIKATDFFLSQWYEDVDGDIFKLCNRYNGGRNGLKYTKPLVTYYFKIKEAYDNGSRDIPKTNPSAVF